MATFSAITTGQIDAESPYDTVLAAQHSNNHLAVIEGDATASAHKIQTAAYDTASVDQAALAANCVGQSELKDATSAQSVSISTLSNGTISLTGGSYSMIVFSATTGGSVVFGGGAVGAGILGFYNTHSSNSYSAYANSRYFSASPPYNFGSLFIYALIDNNTSEILALSVGGDPIWAYHGKTDIRPQRTDRATGKNYRFEKTVEGILIPDLKANPSILEGYLDGALEAVDTPIEITLDYKDRDMNDKPHPWCENPPEFFVGKTVVLLRPNAKLEQGLYDIMKESHAKESFKIIEDGYINIDNIDIPNSYTPDELMVVNASWKNTGI